MKKVFENFLSISFLYLVILVRPSFSSTEPKVFDGLWDNTKDSFTGENAYYHLGAIALTPLIISTGADAEVQETFSKQSSDIFVPGAVAGVLAPALIAGPLYWQGKKHKDNESLRASFAVVHSTIITVSYISVLKGITGRPPPKNEKSTSMRDQSEESNFGFLERGVVWGWPSGHMGTTMALVSTLTHLT